VCECCENMCDCVCECHYVCLCACTHIKMSAESEAGKSVVKVEEKFNGKTVIWGSGSHCGPDHQQR
jgi:hypothetical protein